VNHPGLLAAMGNTVHHPLAGWYLVDGGSECQNLSNRLLEHEITRSAFFLGADSITGSVSPGHILGHELDADLQPRPHPVSLHTGYGWRVAYYFHSPEDY
jgi:hypothetical protein